MNLRIRACLPHSDANGPGDRAVVWFQGCTLRCDGCCNPQMQDLALGSLVFPADLAVWALRQRVEGVTLSGGEPLQQDQDALLEFLCRVCEGGLSVVLFTGYTQVPAKIAALCDAAIVGPYIKRLPQRGICASANQKLILYTDRYVQSDFDRVPPVEIFVGQDGTRTVTGVNNVR